MPASCLREGHGREIYHFSIETTSDSTTCFLYFDYSKPKNNNARIEFCNGIQRKVVIFHSIIIITHIYTGHARLKSPIGMRECPPP